MPRTPDTHQRALTVNLDPTCYGTFAEIGAGQEVARWFMKVGGAAGTVAKTISAYDMAFSDAIYGRASRYVSRERLLEMLAHEFPLLAARLGPERARKTRFFVFADTVAARNYAGTNECHGWLGLRFEHRPRAQPSDVRLHVNLRDGTNLLQQEALGILGVNLVHAAFFGPGRRARRLDVLLDGLSCARIEIDFAELTGPAFADVDARALGLALVRGGLARAVAFTERGALVPPTEFLRKRALVLERVRARAGQGLDLAPAARALRRSHPDLEHEPLLVSELGLVGKPGARSAGDAALSRRLAAFARARRPVLVTDFATWIELVRYLRRYTQAALVQVIDVARLIEALAAGRDDARAGGAFEALGQMLGAGARLHVLPQPVGELRAALRRAGVELGGLRLPRTGRVGAADFGLEPALEHLRAHLLAAGWVVPLAPRPGRASAARPRPARR